MPAVRIEDHWAESVADYILEQYKYAENWKSLLKSVIDKFSYVESQLWILAPVLDFRCRVKDVAPSGNLLDFLAGIVGVERLPDEDDADFYNRFKVNAGVINAGTADYVINNVSLLSGDNDPVYFEESDEVFFVYTPNGRQLFRSEVKKLAPAGYVGAPAARLMTATGKRIVNGRGKLFPLLTDDGRPLLTEDGRQLLVNLHKAKQILCVANDRNIGKIAQPSE